MTIEDKLAQYTEEAEQEPPPEHRSPGQPKKASTKARERLAKELGVLADTIRKKQIKVRKKSKEAVTDLKPLGMNLSPEFMAEMAKAQAYIDQCDTHLKQAQGRLRCLRNDKTINFPEARLERAWEEIHDAAIHVRGLRPVSLCPWCKGMEGVQEACAACQGAGYITQSQEHAVPLELLDEDEPKVMKGGKLIPLGSQPAPADEQAEDDWGLG